MDAGDVLAAGQREGLGAGGDDQDVVGQGALGGVQDVLGGAQAGGLDAEPQVDAEGGEVHREGGALGLAEQDGLGQRRSVVGLVGLGAQQGDRAVPALLAQGDGGLHTRHAGADDDDAAVARGVRLLTHTINCRPRAPLRRSTRERDV